jgi:hypothetical protein
VHYGLFFKSSPLSREKGALWGQRPPLQNYCPAETLQIKHYLNIITEEEQRRNKGGTEDEMGINYSSLNNPLRKKG